MWYLLCTRSRSIDWLIHLPERSSHVLDTIWIKSIWKLHRSAWNLLVNPLFAMLLLLLEFTSKQHVQCSHTRYIQTSAQDPPVSSSFSQLIAILVFDTVFLVFMLGAPSSSDFAPHKSSLYYYYYFMAYVTQTWKVPVVGYLDFEVQGCKVKISQNRVQWPRLRFHIF